MSADSCRLPNCENEPLGSDAPAGVRSSFCSAECDVRYGHLKADADDARRAAEREAADERGAEL